MMRELGMGSTTLEVVRHYGDAVDRWVIDQQDARSARTIAGLGKHVTVADTLMSNRRKSVALAHEVINLARRES
jgi:2-phospho-L-lactate transferase/gluconeogenesis factor (CofD/UPF0052 family)